MKFRSVKRLAWGLPTNRCQSWDETYPTGVKVWASVTTLHWLLLSLPSGKSAAHIDYWFVAYKHILVGRWTCKCSQVMRINPKCVYLCVCIYLYLYLSCIYKCVGDNFPWTSHVPAPSRSSEKKHVWTSNMLWKLEKLSP